MGVLDKKILRKEKIARRGIKNVGKKGDAQEEIEIIREQKKIMVTINAAKDRKEPQEEREIKKEKMLVKEGLGKGKEGVMERRAREEIKVEIEILRREKKNVEIEMG